MRVRACCSRMQMCKNIRLVVLSDMLLNPTFKMTTSFANIEDCAEICMLHGNIETLQLKIFENMKNQSTKRIN